MRTRIGIKPGVGPVIKVMRDAADHPWTTPNADWDKFIINSEVQEIAYGHVGISHTFEPADYDWPPTTSPDYRYWPDEANWIWRSSSAYQSGNQRAHLNLAINPANVPGGNLNAFHFIVRDADDLRGGWRRIRNRYNAGDSYDITHQYYQPDPTITYDSNTGSWALKFGPNGLALWPGGQVGGSNAETSGPNSRSYYQDRTFKFAYYRLDLPLDDSPYPAIIGTPASGKKVFRLDPTTFKMAKPGFDYRTATREQLLFSDDKIPLKVVKSGTVTLAPSTMQEIDLGANYDPTTLVEYQCNVTGEDLFIPPMRGSELAVMDVYYSLSGRYLTFLNSSSVSLDIRFFVMSMDDLEPSSGTRKVFELKDGGFVLRRPNTDGSRLSDVILDTSMPVMPIIKQGWIPFSEMVASNSLFRGDYMATVNFDAKGMKPFILARLCRRHKTNINQYWFLNFQGKKCNQIYNYLCDSSFLCQLKDNQVRFYCSSGRVENAWYDSVNVPPYIVARADYGEFDVVGIRYYVFAVPNSV